MNTTATKITVKATVNSPVEKVWKSWNDPADIMNWCSAMDDWHVPSATNDLKVGGKFSTRMEAKDKSFGFDFGGEYTTVQKHEQISYTMGDGRKVDIYFKSNGDQTEIEETFEAETQNSEEMQKDGWQAILNNFKKYTENL
jgi:uncharacterized protein YndB with AHSA1/START domain